MAQKGKSGNKSSQRNQAKGNSMQKLRDYQKKMKIKDEFRGKNFDRKMQRKAQKGKQAIKTIEASRKTQALASINQAIAQGFTSLNKQIESQAAVEMANANLQDANPVDSVQDAENPFSW